MSAENVELVKSLQPDDVDLVELFREGGSPPYTAEEAARFGEDFQAEFIASIEGVPRLAYSGLVGFIEGWRDWLEAWATYRIAAEEFVDLGDEIVVMIRVKAQTTRDSVVVEHEPAGVWSIRDGKVSRIRLYLDRGDAMREAASSAEGEGVAGDSRLELKREQPSLDARERHKPI
jgi:hypothetical protein